MERVGQRVSAAGGQLTRSVSLPLAAIGGLSVKAFADFDAAMNQSIAIMGDVSDSLKNEMASAARTMAKETVFSAKQAAESYFFLASAGLDAEASIAALPKVAKFAQAGMFDMALATDLLTDAQSALGLTIRDDAVANMENMVRVSDVLVRANTLANATVEQFSTSLTREAGAALKSMNKDVEEGVALLAAFADQGVKGEVAGTGLSRIVRLMSKAALDNAEAYDRLNVSVFDAHGNMRNFADIIGDLENAFADLSPEQRAAELANLGFQARVQGVILPLIGTSEAIRTYEEELRHAAGFTEQVAAKQLQSFANRMRLVKDRIVDVFITLGGSLAPLLSDFANRVVTPLVAKLSRLAEDFARLPKPIRAAAAAVLTLVAAAGPALIVSGALTTAWGVIASSAPAVLAALTRVLAVVTGPAGWIAAAAATLLAWKPVREFLIDLGRRVFAHLREWIGVAVEFLGRLWDALRPARNVLGEAARFFIELHSATLVVVRTVRDELLQILRELFKDSGISNWRELFSNALESIVQGVARAALVFEAWWESTEDGRKFLLALSRVIAADVADAISTVIDWVRQYVAWYIRLTKIGYEAITAFLEWSGALKAVQFEIERATLALRLLAEWTRKSFNFVVEWVQQMGGLSKVVGTFDPVLGAVLAKMENWAKRAKASVEWNEKLSGSQEETSESAEELTEWQRKMDESAAGVLAEVEALNAAEEEREEQLEETSKAIDGAVNSMAAAIAENEALLDALIDSSDQYEILNTLLDAGVPLADALSGAYDEQAKKLNALDKALADLIANRERANELAEEAAKLERELAEAMQEAMDVSASGALREGGGNGPLFDPESLEGISVAAQKVGGAIQEIRKEEEQRKEVLEEINALMEAGVITTKEAAEAAKKLGATAEQVEIDWSRVWESIAETAIVEMSRALAAILDETKSTSDALKSIIIAAFTAAGAAIAGPVGAAIGSLFGSIIADSLVGGDRDRVAGVVGLGGEETFGNTLEAARRMNDIMLEITNEVEELGRLFGFTASGFEDIRVVIQESGRAAVEINGEIRAVFDNVQDAQAFAARLALAFADVAGGVGDFVEMLQFAANQAENAEEFNRAVNALREIMEVELGKTGTAVFDAIANFHRLSDALQDVGLSSARAGDVLARDLGAIRDQITGAVKSERELFEMRRAEFNREIERERQRQKAALARAEADIAAAEAELARITSSTAFTEAQLTAFEIDQVITDQLNEEMRARLDAARELLFGARQAAETARAALDNLPDLIGPGEFTNRANQQQRRREMEHIRDLIDQMAFDRLLEDMTDLEAGLARLESEYQANLEKAHGNAELIAALTEEYRLQEEQLRRNIQLSAVETFQGFLGIGDDPFSQLQDGFDTAVSAIRDAGFGAKRTARMIGRLTAAYQRQLDVLSRQEFVSIGDQLMGFLDRYYSGAAGFEEFRMNLERMRFELELLNARRRFEILKAEGTLAQAVLDQMQGVFDFIAENPIDWGKFVMPSAPRVQRAARSVNNAFEEMARRLKTAKEGIREFLLSLQTGAFGGRSNRQAFEAARAQFRQIRQGVQAGNIQAIEQFPEIARRFLEIARERFGSTARFQEILAQVESAGLGALDIDRVREDNVVFDQRFLDQQAHHVQVDRSGHRTVADAVRQGFALQAAEEERSREDILLELRGLRDSQESLNHRLAAIEGNRRTRKAATG